MISSDVVILTKAELKEIEDRAFQRGVERGKYEAMASAPRCSSLTADDIYAMSRRGDSCS